MKTMETGTPQLLDFGVTNERAWEVGLACGGKVKVFVERAVRDGPCARVPGAAPWPPVAARTRRAQAAARSRRGMTAHDPRNLAALERRSATRPVVLATRLPSGEQRLLPDPSAAD